MSTPKRRKLYTHECEGCGKRFFSHESKQSYCSRNCASKYKVRIRTGSYSVTAFTNKENAKKIEERNRVLAERDRKAAAWLGKDACGVTRGRVPVGNTHRNGYGLFARWY